MAGTSGTAIGIDFGGTTVKAGAVTNGKIVARLKAIPTQNHAGPDSLLAAIQQAIDELRRLHPEVSAIGAGLPGIVDSVEGRVWQLSNVPGWEDVPLTALLEEWTGLPSVIDNDANLMAYGEWLYGAGREGVNVVCVTLGTGVGGGLILNRELYRGSRLGAGEIGQMTIDPNGPLGQYNNKGALEKYVGNRQIAERAQVLYGEAGLTKTIEDCSPLNLELAARAGDRVAHQVWEEVGFAIGIALCNVVWLLNPDRIVIGGGVAAAWEYIFEPIRRTIAERTMEIFSERLAIVPATLGNDAGMIGSAALALDVAAQRARSR
jgi:glucokinase